MTLSPEAKWSVEVITGDAEFLAGQTQGGLNFEEVPNGYILAEGLLREIRRNVAFIAREVKLAREAATA